MLVAPGQHWVTIPYSLLTEKNMALGQPLIIFTLNGSLQVPFLLDTGQNQTVLGTDIAKKLALPLAPAVMGDGQPLITLGKQRQMAKVSMKAGDLRLSNHHIIVLDHETLALSPNYDGVLAVDVLNTLALLLNPQAHTITVWYPGELQPWQIEKLGFTHAYVLPMTENEYGFWHVKARLTSGGISDDEDLLLDTGANRTIISDRVAEHLGLKPIAQTAGKTLYSNGSFTMSAVEKAQIGDLTLLNLPLFARHATTNEPAILGMNVLSGYRVLMDFPAGKVYLLPNPATVPTITVGPTTTPAPSSLPPPAAP